MHDIAKQHAPRGPHRPGHYSDGELDWIYSWANINRKCNIFFSSFRSMTPVFMAVAMETISVLARKFTLEIYVISVSV